MIIKLDIPDQICISLATGSNVPAEELIPNMCIDDLQRRFDSLVRLQALQDAEVQVTKTVEAAGKISLAP